MRGDIVFRVYGLHEGRAADSFFGCFRSRPEAEAEIAKLLTKEMHGHNWARRYHDRGFEIREHAVATDFEVPERPTPRERYKVDALTKANAPGTWVTSLVEVLRRSGADWERACGYERDHAMFRTFEPFRQGTRELALVSRHYTTAAVLDLRTGEILAEETETEAGTGFCPVGFHVPDWWDVNDGSIIPGSEYWNADNEWPVGNFGFVWGCHWGDDTSWKVHYLDLSRVQEGALVRDDRFGYVALATSRDESARPPPFIDVAKVSGKTRVTFSVVLDFDLESGAVDEAQHAALKRR